MKRRYFSKEPTVDEKEKYGLLYAYAITQVKNEKMRSRVSSAAIALITGTALSLIGENPSERIILSNYLVPVVINGIAQMRTERVNRKQVERDEKIGQIVNHKFIELRNTLTEAQLPIPEIWDEAEIRTIFGYENNQLENCR